MGVGRGVTLLFYLSYCLTGWVVELEFEDVDIARRFQYEVGNAVGVGLLIEYVEVPTAYETKEKNTTM